MKKVILENKADIETNIAYEVQIAEELDKRNININETKKRAVLTARSYDQFRNLVRCAETGQKSLSAKELTDVTSINRFNRNRLYNEPNEAYLVEHNPFLKALREAATYQSPWRGRDCGKSSNQCGGQDA